MKKRQNAELRKPDILNHYYKVILKEGLEGASIAKVAKRMKINPSLIIHYFGNKDNMTVALVDHMSRRYNKLFMNMKIETSDPQKRLDRLVEILCSDEWYKHTDISGDYSIISISFRNKKVLKHLQDMYNDFIKLIKRELEDASASGKIKINNPERTAELIVSTLEGYRHFKHFYIDEAASENFREDMEKTLKQIIQNG
ncbi:MAG TPA: TetR/AcrR family transcriptional regulator [Spirochaetota bacterium]|nr:TetR/AcrR family transcriptional regulator [Spirochaetota bacterium]HPJ34572.1 TetR/AcrR family transcriptional regulator [Spirochaetota bacterium]